MATRIVQGNCCCRSFESCSVTYCNIPLTYIPNSTWVDGAGIEHQSYYSPYSATLDSNSLVGLTLYYSDGSSETIYGYVHETDLDDASVGGTGVNSGGQLYFKGGSVVIEHTDGYDYTLEAFSCMPNSIWYGPSDGNASIVVDNVVHEGGATRTVHRNQQ